MRRWSTTTAVVMIASCVVASLTASSQALEFNVPARCDTFVGGSSAFRLRPDSPSGSESIGTPVTFRIVMGDDVHLQNGVVRLRVYAANWVWDYDVPPTPEGSLQHTHYLCPDLFRDDDDDARAGHDALHRCRSSAAARVVDGMLQPMPHVVSFILNLTDSYYRVTAEMVNRDTGERLFSPLKSVAFRVGELIPARAVMANNRLAAKEAAAREKMKDAAERRARIAREYVPLNPNAYRFDASIFSAPVRAALERAKNASAAVLLAGAEAETEVGAESGLERARARARSVAFAGLLSKETADSGVYSFPLFTPEYCSLLIAEIDHIVHAYAHLNERPNSMNRYGVVLGDFGGFHDFFTRLQTEVVAPIAARVFPEWSVQADGSTTSLDSHHAFSIKYKSGGDVTGDGDEALDYHMDESEVTVNVCIGKTGFKGGNVFFNGARDTPSEKRENVEIAPVIGTALFHRGQHWHGARRITDGERYNVILWSRASRMHESPLERYAHECHANPADAADGNGGRGGGRGRLPIPTVTEDGNNDDDEDEDPRPDHTEL